MLTKNDFIMHEMSIVKGIIKIAENEAKKAKVTSFSAIDLEIGTLAGIEFDALEFVWNIAVNNTVLEKATKNINIILAKAVCKNCKTEHTLEFIHDPCPKCESFQKNLIQGKELNIKTLTT